MSLDREDLVELLYVSPPGHGPCLPPQLLQSRWNTGDPSLVEAASIAELAGPQCFDRAILAECSDRAIHSGGAQRILPAGLEDIGLDKRIVS